MSHFIIRHNVQRQVLSSVAFIAYTWQHCHIWLRNKFQKLFLKHTCVLSCCGSISSSSVIFSRIRQLSTVFLLLLSVSLWNFYIYAVAFFISKLSFYIAQWSLFCRFSIVVLSLLLVEAVLINPRIILTICKSAVTTWRTFFGNL